MALGEDTFAKALGGFSRFANPTFSALNDSDKERLRLEKQIANMQADLDEAGLDSSLQEPRENLFFKTLNFIAKPMQAVEGVVDSALVRRDLGRVGLLGAASRGMEERISGSDILRRAKIKNPIVRGVAGFGIDMALDPLGWAKFGAKGLSTIGGQVLSPQGNKIRKAAETFAFKEATKLTSKIQSSSLLDDVGKVTAEVDILDQQSKNLFDGFKLLGQVRKDATQARRLSDPAARTLLESRAFRNLDLAQSKLRVNLPSDIHEIENLIAKPTVRFSMGVPFLGHFQGKSPTVLSDKASTLQKALKTTGDILSPGEIKLGEFTIPSELSDGLSRVADIARDGLSEVAARATKALDIAEKAPIVGGAVKKTRGATNAITSLVGALGKGFQRTFARTYLQGESARASEIGLQMRLGSLAELGQEEMLKVLPEATSEEGRALLSNVATDLDALAYDTIDEYVKSADKMSQGALLDNLSRLARGLDLPERTFDDLKVLEKPFRARLAAKLSTMDPKSAELMQRIVSSFDSMVLKEQAHGMPVNFFEYYLPHRFHNLHKGTNFTAQRKFATLGDAFERANLVGSSDLPSLWFSRWKASEEKLARGQYFNRMVLENAFDPELTARLYEAARFQPDSAEAALLKRARQDPRIVTKEIEELLKKEEASKVAKRSIKKLGLTEPTNLTPELVDEGKRFIRARDAAKASGLNANDWVQNPGAVDEAVELAEGKLLGPANVLTDDVKEVIADSLTRFSDQSRAEHFMARLMPYSSQMPDPYYKEMARFTEEVIGPNGEKASYVLPVEIARAIEENRITRDVVKESIGKSDFGRAALRVMDSTVDWFKRWNTLPWPGYWSQNMFGDTTMRWIDAGINGVNPGTLGLTHNLISDPAAVIKLPNGSTLTGRVFQDLLKRNGISLSPKDLIDTMNAAGDLNISEAVRRRGKDFKGHLQALAKGQEGSVTDALTGAHEFMAKNFENVFRANHVVNRLSMGDSIQDALRNTQEALINYRDMTNAEKSIARRFYFFYGWTSKAIKKQVNSLFTNPGDIQAQVKLARNIAETFSEPGALPTAEEKEIELLRSQTEREQLSFGLGKTKDGKDIIGRGFGMPLNVPLAQFTLSLPRTFSVKEIISSVGDDIQRNLQKQAASANPIFASVGEAFTGKNLYFDKPLSAKFLRRLPDWVNLAQKIAPFQFSKIPGELLNDLQVSMLGAVPDGKGNYIADPGLYYLATHVIPGFGRGVSTARALASHTVPTELGITRALTGLRFEEADLERSGLYDEKERLADLINRYSVKERLGE